MPSRDLCPIHLWLYPQSRGLLLTCMGFSWDPRPGVRYLPAERGPRLDIWLCPALQMGLLALLVSIPLSWRTLVKPGARARS